MLNDDNQLDDFFGYKPEEEKKTKNESEENFFKNLKARIKLIPKILSKKERYLIFAFLFVAAGSLVSIPFTSYYHFTKAQPAYGGSLTEGVVGQPRYVNPLLSQSNDADRDLVDLVYSGLMKYNEDGKLIPDLAKSYEISSDGLNYTVYLKDNAKWSDGEKVSADDIIFTIQSAQNPDYASPQRINWQGVDVAKINDNAVMFKLKNKYAQFLNNLTINILPKHIWEDVKPINFALSDYNLKPVGSGPYEFSKLKKDKSGQISSYELVYNKNFYDGRPYIDNININFYNSEDELINAYNKNEVEDIGSISPENLDKIRFKQRLDIKQIEMPRYFAAFLNPNQSVILADKNVRLALSYATDKKEIINKVLNGNGVVVDSPMIGEILGVSENAQKYNYDPDQAKKVLSADGWGNPGADGVLTKNKTRLSLKITTSNWPELAQTASVLKDQWQKIGVEVTVDVEPTPALQQIIKDRDYDVLLFGEILNIDPDPFSLWDSSQKKDPGLNLALYDNKTADGLLEDARQTLNPLERMKKYNDFQKLVVDDAPAVFLYNPYYLYGQTKDVKGNETKIISMPSDRFSNVEKWYINTKRSFGK